MKKGEGMNENLFEKLSKIMVTTIVIMFFVYYAFGDNETITKNDVIKTVLIFASLGIAGTAIGHFITYLTIKKLNKEEKL